MTKQELIDFMSWLEDKHYSQICCLLDDEFTLDRNLISEAYIKQLHKPDVSGSFLCGGCNVREPHEHRCHGEGCKCDSPICMEQQGRITHEQLMEIVNSALAKK